jgi:hypothetical protein
VQRQERRHDPLASLKEQRSPASGHDEKAGMNFFKDGCGNPYSPPTSSVSDGNIPDSHGNDPNACPPGGGK